MLLLDIPGQVPSSFKTFRVGYDATAVPPRRAVGIHHPNGNVKRISYANDTCARTLCASLSLCWVLTPTTQCFFIAGSLRESICGSSNVSRMSECSHLLQLRQCA